MRFVCETCEDTGREALYRGKRLGCSLRIAKEVRLAIRGNDPRLLRIISATCKDRFRNLGMRLVEDCVSNSPDAWKWDVCSECQGWRIVQVGGIPPA